MLGRARAVLGPLLGVLIASAPTLASAREQRASKQELTESGIEDPRRRELPSRHRLRLVLHADYVRLSKACNGAGECRRFHYAPLMLDFGYQLQFLKYLMFRPSVAAGANVANSRNAMPAMLKPALKTGFQHRLFGLALGYSYTWPFPATIDATGNAVPIGQPVLWNQHAFDAEVSFTSRIDRTAITFAITTSAVNANLLHFDIDKTRWFFRLGLTGGVFFDVGKNRKRKRKR
ncbi:MAG: hypothetical protein KC468_09700 [Myxococcales bacterium]|nr:hypothetical protein [Myxococcales bacterium]